MPAHKLIYSSCTVLNNNKTEIFFISISRKSLTFKKVSEKSKLNLIDVLRLQGVSDYFLTRFRDTLAHVKYANEIFLGFLLRIKNLFEENLNQFWQVLFQKKDSQKHSSRFKEKSRLVSPRSEKDQNTFRILIETTNIQHQVCTYRIFEAVWNRSEVYSLLRLWCDKIWDRCR